MSISGEQYAKDLRSTVFWARGDELDSQIKELSRIRDSLRKDAEAAWEHANELQRSYGALSHTIAEMMQERNAYFANAEREAS